MKQGLATLIVGILGTITFIGLVYFSLGEVKAYLNKSLELETQHQCAQDYRMEYRDEGNGTTIVQPLEGPYKQCIEARSPKNQTAK